MIEPPIKLTKPKDSFFVSIYNRLVDFVLQDRCVFGTEFEVNETKGQPRLVHLRSSLLDVLDAIDNGQSVGEVLGVPPVNSGITINDAGEWVDSSGRVLALRELDICVSGATKKIKVFGTEPY